MGWDDPVVFAGWASFCHCCNSMLIILTLLLLAINTAAHRKQSVPISGTIPRQIFRFEHSVDGNLWADALEVSVTLGDGIVDRSGYAAALKDLLSSTAAPSSLRSRYFLRSTEGNGAFGSIPLSCWAVAGANAVVEVAIGLNGDVRGVSLMAPCAGRGLDGVGDGEMAVVDRVKLIRPQVVSIAPAEGMGQVAGDVAERLVGGGTGATEVKNDKVAKKPDERTWLQKNWLFVALGLFIFANKLGGANN